MANSHERLINWLEQLENFKLPNYNDLPDIDLYMDQVITYLDRTFQVLSTSSLDKIITPSMINNYVKGSVVTPPISKKYNKEHLALIEQTCALKQVLSLAEIKQIFDIKYQNNYNESFDDFKQLHETTTKNASSGAIEILNSIKDTDKEALIDLATNLAVSANANITIAKRILFLLKLEEKD